MSLQDMLSQLEQAILPILEAEAFELVEMNFLTSGRRPTLRLLVDRKEGGISLGDCARLNTKVGETLDKNNLIQDGYMLEVSSPGLDRPLKTPRDFARCLNRKVRFFLNEPINGKVEIQGEIKELNEDSLFVQAEGENLDIPLAKIARAKQVIE